ncbi:MAG: site-specific DNA-methyltransferase, partial [Candidatus Nanohaloarchaea archaeon]
MQTRHEVIFSDARTAELEEGSVDLVVTSPPYPMIEMWDEMFSRMDREIEEALEKDEGEEAFELMHGILDEVWETVDSALKEGGIVCINVGDATRKIGGDFRMFSNHFRIIEFFRSRGYRQLPGILWRKPANSAAKFMGSGMLPPNAYVTLGHEHILVFRKGGNRSFDSKEKRYSSAYFWEERNTWFSDLWEDVNGTLQQLESSELRDRSAAYPLEIPYRLINMYSLQGDTVLDPFWGTGTTTLAAIASARNSIGIEVEEEFSQVFERELDRIKQTTRQINR